MTSKTKAGALLTPFLSPRGRDDDAGAAAVLGSLSGNKSSSSSKKRRRMMSPPAEASPFSFSQHGKAKPMGGLQPSAKRQSNETTYTQTYLDFGQRSYGKRTLCSACGLLYVNGEDDDESVHAAHCRAQKKGIAFPGWKDERVVQRGEGWRILEVRPTDPACHLLKLSEVKAVMDADMSFTGPPSTSDLLPLSPPPQPASTSGKPQAQSQHHKAKPVLQDTQRSRGHGDAASPPAPLRRSEKAFVYVRDRRVLGCVVAEPISHAHPVLPPSTVPPPAAAAEEGGGGGGGGGDTQAHGEAGRQLVCYEAQERREASMGVVQMWVDGEWRRRGVATALLESGRERLFFGHVVPRARMAFSQLSSMGYACASRYMQGSGQLLVY